MEHFEQIGTRGVGVLMAQNRGVQTGTFTSEAEALAWLDAGAAAPRYPRRRSS